MEHAQTSLDSPVGPLRIEATADGIVASAFSDEPTPTRGDGPALAHALRLCDELAAYFDGSLHDFTTPLAPAGTTFQQRVWDALREIPFATTISYGQLATRVGCSDGARAVGLANARNPIAIVIPCHRVVASDGTLHGYAGGLSRKAALLDHEQQHARVATTLFTGR